MALSQCGVAVPAIHWPNEGASNLAPTNPIHTMVIDVVTKGTSECDTRFIYQYYITVVVWGGD